VTISTDDGAIQSGSATASSALDAARRGDGRAPAPGVDPRLAVAVDDTAAQNKRGGDKVGHGIATAKADSGGKVGIDGNGAGDMGKVSPAAALAALGGAASGLLGGIGQGGGGAPMPPMPQVPASSASQSQPSPLSSPAARQSLASLLGGPGGAGGGPGSGRAAVLGARGGRGGTSGPSTPGATEYQRRIIDLANRVVSAGIPYAWGGGTLDGPGQGISDGGAADAAGDYNKSGFDCSGLARYLVYQASGVELPRTSGAQYSAGYPVSAADARPGDLAFNPDPGEHVMIYVGDGKIVEAQQSGTNVMFGDAAERGVTQYVRVVDDTAA
jgi:hypothetical protein